LAALFCRKFDKYLGTRTSVYGWGCYFGSVVDFDPAISTNVCIRCGAGYSSSWLIETGLAYRNALRIQVFKCPKCETKNYFTRDEEYRFFSRQI